jgi:hypothetical protein
MKGAFSMDSSNIKSFTMGMLGTDSSDNKPHATLPGLTFAILVPDRERLLLYLRPEAGRMRFIGTIFSPKMLRDQVRMIPSVSILVLAGNHLSDRVGGTILPHREFYVVPDVWFRHISDRDTALRARTAARVVHAHLFDPIILRLPTIDDDHVPY